MEDNKKCIVQFKYKYNGSKYDDVGVVGNLNELNNWNINNPVNLSYEKDGFFVSSKIPLSHNTHFEYKYVFFRNNEHVWENLPYNKNRSVEIKNETTLILIDKEGDAHTIIEENIPKQQTKPKPQPAKTVKARPKIKIKPESENNKKKPIDVDTTKEDTKIENNEKPKENKTITKKKEIKVEDDKEEQAGDVKEKKIVKKKLKKKIKKKKQKKEKEENEIEEIKKIEEEKKNERTKILSLNSENIDPNLEEKLKVLNYDSDNEEENKKENEQKQREPQQYSDIKEDDDIIMCSFNLPFEPVKKKILSF